MLLIASQEEIQSPEAATNISFLLYVHYLLDRLSLPFMGTSKYPLS